MQGRFDPVRIPVATLRLESVLENCSDVVELEVELGSRGEHLRPMNLFPQLVGKGLEVVGVPTTDGFGLAGGVQLLAGIVANGFQHPDPGFTVRTVSHRDQAGVKQVANRVERVTPWGKKVVGERGDRVEVSTTGE